MRKPRLLVAFAILTFFGFRSASVGYSAPFYIETQLPELTRLLEQARENAPSLVAQLDRIAEAMAYAKKKAL